MFNATFNNISVILFLLLYIHVYKRLIHLVCWEDAKG